MPDTCGCRDARWRQRTQPAVREPCPLDDGLSREIRQEITVIKTRAPIYSVVCSAAGSCTPSISTVVSPKSNAPPSAFRLASVAPTTNVAARMTVLCSVQEERWMLRLDVGPALKQARLRFYG
jgi:hypothetical protein